jgi:NAD(P)-dependent dehydrogenase (short-subunit alcohol dehydrogenase family)
MCDLETNKKTNHRSVHSVPLQKDPTIVLYILYPCKRIGDRPGRTFKGSQQSIDFDTYFSKNIEWIRKLATATTWFKVAVVTGAASGMGKAIAELYAKEGAKVILADYNFDGAEAVVNGIIASGGTAKAVKANVAELADIENMIDTAVSEYGTLDILVNNAGIMDGFEPVGDITDEKWDLIFDVNTKGVMRAMRKAIPIFLAKESGVIINTASTGGFCGAHAGAAYGASKHAVIGLTKNTGFMYAKKGIRCNAIAPGAVETNIGSSMTNINGFGMERAGLTHALSPRSGQPEEIAQAALFLASNESSFVNGTVITVDGGWTAAF